MSDKDFKVKNKLVVNGLTGGAGPLIANPNKEIDSVEYLTPLQGGTGTTTFPSSGQVLYSAGGTTYNPTTLNTLDVKGATYSADAPSSPFVGQVWVESDSSSDSFDPNIMRRKSFTATAGQTVFTTDYVFIDGYEQVYFNGMLLLRNTDYTTNGSTYTVTLASGAAVGDIVEVVTVTNLNSINTVATTGANTITATNASTTPLTIQGAASQSAKLLDLTNNSGSSLAYFGSNGALNNPGVSLSSYGQVACQSTDTGISISGGTGYPNGGTIVFRGNNGGAGGTAANGLELLAGGTERMRITSTGLVGIGTATPAAKLHIDNTGGSNSPLRVKTPAGGYNAFELVSAYTGNISWGFNDSGGSGAMNFYQYDSNGSYARSPLQIDSSGNIAIGGVAPNSTPVLRVNNLNTVGTFNWSASMLNASLTAGQNNIILVGKGESARNSGYIGFKWNGDGSTSNLLTFGQYQVDNVVNIDGNGYLLVGYQSSNGAYRVQVNSQIFATSSSIATSDGRYKENVDTITGGLDIVDSLRPVSFTWKEHPVHNFVAGKTVGFIAQEVKESLSQYDWVDNIIKTNTSDAILDEDGNEVTPAEEFLGIAESNIIPLLVAAVKELKARVETLEAN